MIRVILGDTLAKRTPLDYGAATSLKCWQGESRGAIHGGAVCMNVRIGLLKHLMQEWAGFPVDEGRLARILNADGKRPPLIWCFNSQQEFPVLAAGLGPDQPVIGIRSLHLVERNDATRYGKDEFLAELYADALLPSVDLEECFVGGNCQAVSVAAHLAFNLLKAGKAVRALITLDGESPLPFPGRVGLIHGARSEMFNPFLRGETPQPRWNMLFADPVAQMVPGTHGEYFKPENAPPLCEAIARVIDLPAGCETDAAAALEVSLDLVDRPPSLTVGSKVTLEFVSTTTLTADPMEIGPVFAAFRWISPEHGLAERIETRPLPIRPGGGVELLTVAIDTPPKAGYWKLYAFVCRESGGPVSWAANHAPRCAVRALEDMPCAYI